jgi:hypothetical protein
MILQALAPTQKPTAACSASLDGEQGTNDVPSNQTRSRHAACLHRKSCNESRLKPRAMVQEHGTHIRWCISGIVFYREIAVVLDRANPAVCLAALVVAGLISYGLFYYVPALIGMRTGYPLYVVGSSTFGTQGGYLMPGLLMGVLQVGWMSVNTFVATTFVLTAFGSKAGPGSLPFGLIAAVWALVLGYVGAKGIHYVARFALYLNLVPLLMIVVVFAQECRRNWTIRSGAPGLICRIYDARADCGGFFRNRGGCGRRFWDEQPK